MSTIIGIWGASSAWGAWDLEKGGWANRLRLFFDAQYLKHKKYDADVYVLGISGDWSSDLLKRFEVEACARHPSIIIFSIGDNDAATVGGRTRNREPIDQFEKNILKLIRLAKRFTRKILFTGIKPVDETRTAPVPWRRTVYYLNEDLLRYDERLRAIARRQRVGYISLRGLLGNGDLSDGLHPNAHGHEKIYRAVKSYLLKHRWLP